MKKSLYDYFSFSMYKYAPESFQLSFRSQKVNLTYEQKNILGNALIRGKSKLMKELKRIIRKSSIFANKNNIIKTLAIRTNEGINTYIKLSNNYGYGRVNIYNIHQKLEVFKDIKKAYNNNAFNIEVTVGKMNEYGKMEKGEVQEIEKPLLLNRIIYV